MKNFFTLLAVVLSITANARPAGNGALEVYSTGNNAVGMDFVIGCTLNEVTYEVQRSPDGIHFTSISTATVTQSRCGTPFYYTDNNPCKGISYYRIKLTNYNGDAGVSNIAAIRLDGGEKIKVVPTLAVNTVSIFYNAVTAGPSEWVIYDMNGRIMNRRAYKLQKGQNEIIFDISQMQRGRFQVRGTTPEETTAAIPLMKQ